MKMEDSVMGLLRPAEEPAESNPETGTRTEAGKKLPASVDWLL